MLSGGSRASRTADSTFGLARSSVWTAGIPAWFRGDAGQVDAARAVLDDDQGIDAAEQHRVHVDEIGRENAAGLSSQELPGLRHLLARILSARPSVPAPRGSLR